MVYEVKQHLYPPLQAPVISAGTMTLTWATTNDVRLQTATNLVNAVWQDVPESEGMNTVTLPMTEPTTFIRLVKGAKPTQPPGMVAWWPGDGNALDIIGTNHGTLMNGATFAEGMVGQAFSFDGVDSYVLLPNLVQGQPEGTVEGWIKLNTWDWASAPAGRFIWASTTYLPHSDSSWDEVALGTHPQYSRMGGEVMFGLESTTSNWEWAFSGVVPQNNVWYHVAGTWGAGGIHLYVDGLLQGSNPYVGPARDYVHYNLLGRSSWPDSVTDGLIDEFSFYNRALTDAEIEAIYDAGNAGKLKPTP